jgi:hypothetical protein
LTLYAEIPEHVRRLVIERIHSISELEIVLLLHRDASRSWTAEQVSAELRIDRIWTAGQLPVLRDRGLLASPNSRPDHFQFRPSDPKLEEAVQALAVSYSDRRVAVISLIYSKPPGDVRVLADAFRVRRED